MKLSKAIVLGSTIVAPKAGGQYFPEQKAGCALGMASIANGCTYGTVTRRVNERERRTLGVEGVWGRWVLSVVRRPCDCWLFRVPRKMRIKDIIAHIFDFHVMKKKNGPWTNWPHGSKPTKRRSLSEHRSRTRRLSADLCP